MERGVSLVRYRKISCESDEFDDIVVNLKNDVLSRNNIPKIILGTGLSASYGVPGMWELSEELKRKLEVHPVGKIKKAWKEKETAIDKYGLEEGLKTLNSSEILLIKEIKKITAKFILEKEQAKLLEIYNKDTGFEKLLLYLNNTVSVNNGLIDITTPNYDRIVEIVCDKCGIPVITGFNGEVFKRFEPLRLKNPGNYVNLKNNCFVRLFKPHGSINWVLKDNQEYMINDDYYLSQNSDNIEIIAPGSSKYEAGMLNNTFRLMREDFNELISDVSKPYSLFIYGYGFNDSHFNTVLFQNKNKNVLVLSKEIKSAVIDKALNNPKVTIFFQEDKKEYIIYKGERFEIDRSLWNMDIFAEVFFS